MTQNTDAHPITTLRQTSQNLQEQSMFAHRMAVTGANNARQISADLAALDLEKAFQQLREMVAIVGGKRANSQDNVVAFPAHQALKQAAE